MKTTTTSIYKFSFCILGTSHIHNIVIGPWEKILYVEIIMSNGEGGNWLGKCKMEDRTLQDGGVSYQEKQVRHKR